MLRPIPAVLPGGPARARLAVTPRKIDTNLRGSPTKVPRHATTSSCRGRATRSEEERTALALCRQAVGELFSALRRSEAMRDPRIRSLAASPWNRIVKLAPSSHPATSSAPLYGPKTGCLLLSTPHAIRDEQDASIWACAALARGDPTLETMLWNVAERLLGWKRSLMFPLAGKEWPQVVGMALEPALAHLRVHAPPNTALIVRPSNQPLQRAFESAPPSRPALVITVSPSNGAVVNPAPQLFFS